MSSDLLTTVRKQLVHGAQHRKRAERRRRLFAAGAAVLVAIGVLGTALWLRTDGSEITTGPASRRSINAACDALADVQAAGRFRDQTTIDALEGQFDEAAAASGDPVLERLGGPGTKDDRTRYNAATRRCRELHAAAFTPRFVPATPSGPSPSVALADYGTPQIVEPITGEPPFPLPNLIVGRNLSEVEAARTSTGAYFARWSYDDPAGHRMYCYAVGTMSGAQNSCGATRQGPERPSMGGTTDRPLITTFPQPDVSFLVLETGAGRYVQQPASGMSVLTADGPLTPPDAIRQYDANGVEQACRRLPSLDPC